MLIPEKKQTIVLRHPSSGAEHRRGCVSNVCQQKKPCDQTENLECNHLQINLEIRGADSGRRQVPDPVSRVILPFQSESILIINENIFKIVETLI